jgi:predicted nucleic acid-binding protein
VSQLVVVYDACVLYPAPLRDFLMRLAQTELFRARWTDDIHDEWIRSVLADRADLTPDQLNRTRLLMNEAIPDCLVTGYGDLIPSLTLPDENDRHVLAAAIVARADIIVTFNLKDFPQSALDQYSIEAVHPDAFGLAQIDLSLDKVCTAVRKQRLGLKKSTEDSRGVPGESRAPGTRPDRRRTQEQCAVTLAR